MLDAGLLVTANSDDPAYFGGYVGENYLAVAEALELGPAALVTLARNSFAASFLSAEQRAQYLERIDAVVCTETLA
jgi:adenosine deaminase